MKSQSSRDPMKNPIPIPCSANNNNQQPVAMTTTVLANNKNHKPITITSSSISVRIPKPQCPLYFVSGVVVVSWYPPGQADDNGQPFDGLIPLLLDSAHRHGVKVSSVCCQVCGKAPQASDT